MRFAVWFVLIRSLGRRSRCVIVRMFVTIPRVLVTVAFTDTV